MSDIIFISRIQAGELLARKIKQKDIKTDLILAIPRGGVVVAAVISQKLLIPLDIIAVKKLSAPTNQELAVGAITYDNTKEVDEQLIASLGVTKSEINNEIHMKQQRIQEMLDKFQHGKKPQVKNKHTILVDDGVATGATIKSAISWLKLNRVKKITLAIPVIAQDVADTLKAEVDNCIFLETPVYFGAVGEFYLDFKQVEDDDVLKILQTGRL